MPLSLVQIRSQRAQMAIQPEMKAIQKKFKGDREGLARAQMALYKERGINPAAGCLPLLIQMPILFGMYAAMTQLATTGLTLDHGHHQSDRLGPGDLLGATHRRALSVQPVRPGAAARRAARRRVPITISVDQNAVIGRRGTVRICAHGGRRPGR